MHLHLPVLCRKGRVFKAVQPVILIDGMLDRQRGFGQPVLTLPVQIGHFRFQPDRLDTVLSCRYQYDAVGIELLRSAKYCYFTDAQLSLQCIGINARHIRADMTAEGQRVGRKMQRMQIERIYLPIQSQ